MHNAHYLDDAALAGLGFAQIGNGVRIHASCVLHGCEHMSLGDHVRIDAFCVVTAREPIEIGSYVHIGSHCLIAGAHGITIGDFAGVSHGARVFSASDDYRASGLLGPQIPEDLRVVHAARVELGRHSCLGANSVVLPGAHLGEGATVGALSLVMGDLAPWRVYAGIPAKHKGERDRDGVLRAEAELKRRADG